MNTWSPERAAQALGTSRKRVSTAARALGLAPGARGVRMRLSPAEVDRLAHTLGVTPPVDGLTRTESVVLAELSRRPLGLASNRAVARACSLSPASAAKAVGSLHAKGLVTIERTVRALGRAREVSLIRANNLHPDWSGLLGQLAHVQAPTAGHDDAPRVPASVRHAFWNLDDAAFTALSPIADGSYIADRALTTGDPTLLAYAASHLLAHSWTNAARVRGRSPRDKALADNLARAAAR